MANYIEYIKPAGGEVYQIRDSEAARTTDLNNKVNITDLLNLVYPIGSIYMSVNNVSPATLFGGTWEQIEDRFLLAAGSSYSAGSTGGAATVALTVNQLPSHNHGFLDYWTTYWDGVAYGRLAVALNGDGNGHSDVGTTGREYTASTGKGEAHNNMPPYLAVYVWKRTA